MRVNAYMYFIAGKLFNKIVEGGYPGICERLRTEGRRGITSCVGGPVAAQDQAQDRMSLERTRGSQERPEPLDGTVAASADFECRCRLGLSAKRSPGKGPSCTSARRPHYFSGDELRDFSDTAALIDLIDLVITVDTSVAHLAGAMGKPVWIFLPLNPDWRWLLDRKDSPWYPSARLFRQQQIADWPGSSSG
jgi:hypothetical protein